MLIKDTKWPASEKEQKRVLHTDTVLWFGKYRGLRASTILEKDPAYLVWLRDNEITLWEEKQVIPMTTDLLVKISDKAKGIKYKKNYPSDRVKVQ